MVDNAHQSVGEHLYDMYGMCVQRHYLDSRIYTFTAHNVGTWVQTHIGNWGNWIWIRPVLHRKRHPIDKYTLPCPWTCSFEWSFRLWFLKWKKKKKKTVRHSHAHEAKPKHRNAQTLTKSIIVEVITWKDTRKLVIVHNECIQTSIAGIQDFGRKGSFEIVIIQIQVP